MSISSNNPVSHEQRQWKTAVAKARRNFGFFWRELFWENQRDEKQVDFAAVLFEFLEEHNGVAIAERLWITNIYCDGLNIHGTILNAPQQLQHIHAGEQTKIPLRALEDWIYTLNGRAYGGYTVNLQRSKMSIADRNRYDIQWGYEFGDPIDVLRYPDLNPKVEVEPEEDGDDDPATFLGVSLTAPKKKGEPTKFFGMSIGGQKADSSVLGDNSAMINQRFDHPTALAQQQIFVNYYSNNPDILTVADERGMAPIHAHTLAGNRHIVRLLLDLGVPANLQSSDGRTAKDIAKAMHWANLVSLLAAAERGIPLPPDEV